MDQRYQRGGLGSTNAAVLLAAAVAAAGCATGGGGGATASVDRQGAKLAVSRTAGFHMAKVAPVTLASKRPVGSDPQARGEGREAAKQAAAERARTASILGLIEQSADPDLIAIFYGSGASGCEPESVLLDLVSPAVEDAYHQGGLGQIGSGFAGRGGGETSVGLGSFATLGKGGDTSTASYGRDVGMLGARRARGPKAVEEVATRGVGERPSAQQESHRQAAKEPAEMPAAGAMILSDLKEPRTPSPVFTRNPADGCEVEIVPGRLVIGPTQIVTKGASLASMGASP